MAFFRSPSWARQALLLIAIFAWGTALVAEDTQAESLLKQGRVDEAAAILNQVLAANAHDGRAHQL